MMMMMMMELAQAPVSVRFYLHFRKRRENDKFKPSQNMQPKRDF